MTKLRIRQKGVIMYLVLVSVLMTIVLAGIILNIITSNARFSHHQVSRVQAYYAAMAGVNYAVERLRSGSEASCWPATGIISRKICRTGGTCISVCDPIDDTLPPSISQIDISVSDWAGSPSKRTITATATYTYTP
mgnify:CR=1 FL=1